MHKKAKLTYPEKKGIPAVMTAQGFHKGKLDFIEVSVIHCLDGIVINASSREVFHRKRLAIPSSTSPSTPLNSSSILNSSTSLNSSNLNSPVKGEQDEMSEKVEKNKKDETEEKKEEKVEILLRDAFGTFKGEVPYYSARALFLEEETAPALKELDEKYEEWIGGEE